MFKRLTTFVAGLLMVTAAYAANPANIPVKQNIAELKALGPAAAQYPDVQVLGYYTAKDGGGGLVHYNPASTATADNAYVFQPTGVTTGRYTWNLGSSPLSLYQCGVKADGTTNNSTQLQACFNAMATNNLGEIYCPASASTINFASSITPVQGGTLRGQNSSYSTGLAASSTPGACYLNHTGASGWAFDYQTPFQSVGNCPSTPGPSFRHLNLNEASTANGFRINTTGTAGFTDNCAVGGGQSQVFGSVFDDLVVTSSQRGTTGIQCNKCFDTTYSNDYFTFFDTQIQAIGSDNQLIDNSKFSFATLRAVDLQSSGTFGNFNTIRDSTFFSIFTNASDFIRSSARSGTYDSNYFEDDFSGLGTIFNLTCALSHTVTNNTMALTPVNVQYWLKVTGNCIDLTITNNYPLGGGNVPSNWNGGAGAGYFANSSKQKIFAWGNPDDNDQTPFVTKEPAPITDSAPAISGSVLGNFDSSQVQSLGGNFAPTINVGPPGFKGAFVFTPQAASGGHVTFHFNPVIQGLFYDLWIKAASASTLQTLTISDGTTTATQAISSGLTPTWYKVITNGSVTNPTIDTYNNDTTHGQNIYVYQWQMVKH